MKTLEMIHKACGKVAFLREGTGPGDKIDTRLCRYPSGHPLLVGQTASGMKVVCAGCGCPIRVGDVFTKEGNDA